jgi:ABC-type protease/lipase transport system fused ATPase/permease subunit
MHLSSGQVKFVAVDEPSSALDAEGEAQLFDLLLKAREDDGVRDASVCASDEIHRCYIVSLFQREVDRGF